MTDFEKFQQIDLIKDLPKEHIKKLFNSCKKNIYQKGDLVMEEGEETYSMFFFLEGEVAVTHTMTMKVKGQRGFSEIEKSLVKLSAGQISIIGEMSVLEELPRSATVKAYTPCILYEISKEDFQNFVKENPEIGTHIILNISKILCHRVRKGNIDIVKLSTALSIALSK